MYTIMPYHTRHEIAPSLFSDRFFRSFFDMNDFMGPATFRVDLKEDPDKYVLQAELPGINKDQINLSVEDNILTISADINSEVKEEKNRCIYSERRTGHVERRFNMENVDQSAITAESKDGILTVSLPKAKPLPVSSPRKIDIA